MGIIKVSYLGILLGKWNNIIHKGALTKQYKCLNVSNSLIFYGFWCGCSCRTHIQQCQPSFAQPPRYYIGCEIGAGGKCLQRFLDRPRRPFKEFEHILWMKESQVQSPVPCDLPNTVGCTEPSKNSYLSFSEMDSIHLWTWSFTVLEVFRKSLRSKFLPHL